MKILIIGSGGREHALAWKIGLSKKVKKIFVAPGNGGIESPLERVDIKPDDMDNLLDFAIKEKIDLTVVGPEKPLTDGIVDRFKDKGLKIFGPSSSAAEIEGSKVFTRQFLSRMNIPQPEFEVFEDSASALTYIDISANKFPVVLKADGLAAGKGVIIAYDRNEASAAVKKIMIDREFGKAGERLLIEKFLPGKEVSFFVLTDGSMIIPMPTAQDYKRISDGDSGPNTGGMGCYSPSAFLSEVQTEEILEKIIRPTISGLAREGRPYRGFLYGGLMITDEGMKVLEFNCRMGDPEAQVILPRIKSDLLDYLMAVADGALSELPPIETHKEEAVTVVISSRGYPASVEAGYEIKGLNKLKNSRDTMVFHAGTSKKDEKILTTGGRVLAVTSMAQTIKNAREKAYKAVNMINFEGMHYRKDIAADVK